MKREIVKIVGLILLISQLLLTLADFAHTESLAIGGFPNTIESHNCGTKELHKPLDSCQPCLPCYRNTHSIAFPESMSFNAPTVRMPLAAPDHRTWNDINTASSVLKRGPPILTAI